MIKKKILKFYTSKIVDLSTDADKGCNIIKCGKDEFTMSKYQKLDTNDENTLAYMGLLCVNDKPLCDLYKDEYCRKPDMQSVGAVAQANMAIIETRLQKYKWKYGENVMEVNLAFIADTLANSMEYYRNMNRKC